MRVSASPKTLKLIRLFCIIAAIIVLAAMGLELYRTADYIEAEGIVTAISQEADFGIETNSKSTIIKYVHYAYTVDGQDYQASDRTFFPFSTDEGDPVTVHCSPADPTLIRDRFLMEAGICGEVFLLVFIMLMSKMISIQKQS